MNTMTTSYIISDDRAEELAEDYESNHAEDQHAACTSPDHLCQECREEYGERLRSERKDERP